jgi:hypothetical protein
MTEASWNDTLSMATTMLGVNGTYWKEPPANWPMLNEKQQNELIVSWQSAKDHMANSRTVGRLFQLLELEYRWRNHLAPVSLIDTEH